MVALIQSDDIPALSLESMQNPAMRDLSGTPQAAPLARQGPKSLEREHVACKKRERERETERQRESKPEGKTHKERKQDRILRLALQ